MKNEQNHCDEHSEQIKKNYEKKLYKKKSLFHFMIFVYLFLQRLCECVFVVILQRIPNVSLSLCVYVCVCLFWFLFQLNL